MANDELREQIFRGELVCFAPSACSLHLIACVEKFVIDAFGADYRRAQFASSFDEYFARTQAVKKRVFESLEVKDAIWNLVAEAGFNAVDCVVESGRVRFVEHDGFLHPDGKVPYYAHRDTWYGNPSAQINFWLPLHDVRESETFCFYPDYFEQAIENTSNKFDFDTWTSTIGFGKSHKARLDQYAVATGDLSHATRRYFAARAGEVLLFSAAHLHQTLPNISGLTRVSVDFRLVELNDHRQGRGAPDVDNLSTGSALGSYSGKERSHVC